MNTVRYTDAGFSKRLHALAAASSLFDPASEQRTRAILDDVRARGDEALLERRIPARGSGRGGK